MAQVRVVGKQDNQFERRSEVSFVVILLAFSPHVVWLQHGYSSLGGEGSAEVLLMCCLPFSTAFSTPCFPVLFILLLGSEESQGAIHGGMSQPEASCTSSDSEWGQNQGAFIKIVIFLLYVTPLSVKPVVVVEASPVLWCGGHLKPLKASLILTMVGQRLS